MASLFYSQRIKGYLKQKDMEATSNTSDRVRESTPATRNKKVDEEMQRDINAVQTQGPGAMKDRLKALDEEWDIERTLELNAGILALAGSLLALTVNKRWAILPAVVTTFLIQHAVQGWCPPLPLFRKMGVRTRRELDREKYALKALRGDFHNADTADKAWKAVNK